MYNAVVCELNQVRKHPNADRLMLATVCGCQVVVSLEAQNGDIGVYFPTDGQLSEEFAAANDLVRRKLEDGTVAGGMFDEKRRVRTQKFRGEISDGYWAPMQQIISTLVRADIDFKSKKLGTEFTEWQGVPICNKYVPAVGKARNSGSGPQQPKKKKSSVMFKEHIDTAQFGQRYTEIQPGDILILTEKVHGTSQRTGHVLVDRQLAWWEKWLIKCGVKIQTTEWDYLVGTRRVVLTKDFRSKVTMDPVEHFNRLKSEHRKNAVRKYYLTYYGADISDEAYRSIFSLHAETTPSLEEINLALRSLPGVPAVGLSFTEWYTTKEFNQSGWHDDSMREAAARPFINNLHKGEVVYYEIVGYEPDGKSIMPTVDTTKLNDKTFIKNYSNAGPHKMTFSYGCAPGQCKVLVYRITRSNEDGQLYEYNWNDIVTRCAELGVETVPHIVTWYYKNFNEAAELLADVNAFASGPSMIDRSHWREGCVVRVESSQFRPQVYKQKNFEFKVLEGLIKDAGIADIEEQESIAEDES